MVPSDGMLRLEHVAKSYPSVAGGEPVRVLEGITAHFASGDSSAIIGPSGSGKSTLLHLIGTLDQPTRGSIFLDGEDLSRLGEQQLAEIRNKKIGFIFQAHHLLPQCSVLENVLVPTLASRADGAAAEERARKLLDRVGLTHRMHHRPAHLSGGERQRVAVVRALINRPKLLLADEPTGALDAASAERLVHLLVELNREEHVTLLMVTHALELAQKMKRHFRIREGRLEAA